MPTFGTLIQHSIESPNQSKLVHKKKLKTIQIKNKKVKLHYLQMTRDPMDWAYQASLSMDSPGKNTEVGSHSLLQGIFLTKGLNPGLLHHRQSLYLLSHQESPMLYIEKPKDSIRKQFEFKIQEICRIQNQYTKNLLHFFTLIMTYKKDIKKTISFIISSKRIKYLGTHLAK